MTVNNTVPFMAKKKAEKRKFIEGIFNLEIFSKMLSQLRDEQGVIKKDFDTESAREDEVSTSVRALEQQRDKTHLEYENRKKMLLKRLEDNTKELEVLEEKLKTYKPIQVEEISKNLNLLMKNWLNAMSRYRTLASKLHRLRLKMNTYSQQCQKLVLIKISAPRV